MCAGLLGLRAGAMSEPEMPGPVRGNGRPEAARLNRQCEGCHVEVAAEWRASLHRASYTDASFKAAHAREPAAFCRECHAPEADPHRLPPPALARIGVACVTCHMPGDVVLAAPRDDMFEETAPHPIRRDPRFASAEACARCHEFAFPDGVGLMQSTIREHEGSRFAERSCADCHMPAVSPGSRRRRHTFAASRDPEMLRRSLVVAAWRSGATAATLRLMPGEVGHAVPTGDLFRRLRVTVEAVGEGGATLARAERFLSRHFDEERYQLDDDRVGLDRAAVEVAIDLGATAQGRPIRWRVAHERVAFITPEGAEVEASTVVWSGVLEDMM